MEESYRNVKYELFVAESLIPGAGNGLFLKTGHRPVGNYKGWIIEEYKGQIRSKPLTPHDSEYAVTRSLDGYHIDGRNAEVAQGSKKSFAHLANQNFRLLEEQHNAYLHDARDKVFLMSHHIFPANMVTEIYVFYGHDYWVTPLCSVSEDQELSAKPVRWSRLPADAKDLYLCTYADDLKKIQRERPNTMAQHVIMSLKNFNSVKNMRVANKVKKKRLTDKMADMRNAKKIKNK